MRERERERSSERKTLRERERERKERQKVKSMSTKKVQAMQKNLDVKYLFKICRFINKKFPAARCIMLL